MISIMSLFLCGAGVPESFNPSYNPQGSALDGTA